MTGARAYGRLERSIVAADAGTVRQRWEYGRRLLCDPSATTPGGELRPGKLAALVDAAHRAGVTLTGEEIGFRLAAGLAYPAESQIAAARGAHETWAALCEAGFPGYEAEPGEGPYDPRTAAERLRQSEKQLALDDPDQLVLWELFDSDQFSELSTLAELRKYAEEMARWTARQQAADERRLAYLRQLLDAVGGDEAATWAQAQAALDQQRQ